MERALTDGIIVAKLDRFGRSFKDALEQIERIDRAGGRLISVQDQFDLGTDHGRLVLRLMLSFAEFERDRFRTSWADAQRNAVMGGVHVCSKSRACWLGKGDRSWFRRDSGGTVPAAEAFPSVPKQPADARS